MDKFSVEVRNLPGRGCYWVLTSGAVDMKTAPELEAACRRLMLRGEARLLLDFAGVDYINSQGLGVILQLQKQLGDQSGGLVVAGLQDRVKRVFTMTGVHKVIALYDNAKDALEQDELFDRERTHD